jgi:hypothetical protein
MNPRAPLRHPAYVAAALCWACGPSSPPGGDPCAFDPLGCAESSEFQVDPGCTNQTALEVELGQDEGGFQPFSATTEPTIHFGSQGGQHLELGFRISNPDATHRRFRVSLGLRARAGSPDGGTATRQLVVDETVLEPGPDGSLQLAGLVVFVPADIAFDGGLIRLDVEDSCGRTAQVQHAFAGR